ncbi:aminotransferase [Bacteroidia bacterium]|nr:aminotransferase [Bacteroidia bacterium]
MEKIYDFDQIIDRHGTNALKTDALAKRYGNADLIPLWVADMDFATPDFITDALLARMKHPIFGYTQNPPGFYPSIIRWLKEQHQWDVKKEWLSYIPGIVKGIGLAINVFSNEGDKVVIQPPVYHPFRLVPQGNKRQVVYNPLKIGRDHYEMDFVQLEEILKDERCKILILSNPHNPAGVVWSSETLATLADICARHSVLVLSDEIHADMALYDNRHTPFATVSDNAANNSITFGAPSKTFNIAGLVSSFSIVPNDVIRLRFYSWLAANELNEPTIFATIATEAAYTHGRKWLKQLLTYLEGNIAFVEQYFKQNLPKIKVVKPQASFLVWLDCRELDLSHNELVDLFVKKAGLALNDGEMFGPGGEGFMRMNIGTPRNVLERACNAIVFR